MKSLLDQITLRSTSGSRWRFTAFNNIVTAIDGARMKTRLLWTLILATAAPALYFGITRPHVSSIPTNLRESIDDLKPVVPPIELPALAIPELPTLTIPVLPPIRPPVRSDPAVSRPEVPIQNQATIDFSTGAPVVRTHGKDQDALESALKEMSDVLKDAKIEVKTKSDVKQ